jgi:hypothetical protein
MRKLKDYLAYCKRGIAEGRYLVQSNPNLGLTIGPGQVCIRYWNNGALVAVDYEGRPENLHYFVAQQLFPGHDRYGASQRLHDSMGNRNYQTMTQAVCNQRRVPLRSRWFRRLVCNAFGLPPYVPTARTEYNK